MDEHARQQKKLMASMLFKEEEKAVKEWHKLRGAVRAMQMTGSKKSKWRRVRAKSVIKSAGPASTPGRSETRSNRGLPRFPSSARRACGARGSGRSRTRRGWATASAAPAGRRSPRSTRRRSAVRALARRVTFAASRYRKPANFGC